jgi:hypothetical protein
MREPLVDTLTGIKTLGQIIESGASLPLAGGASCQSPDWLSARSSLWP